MQKKKIIIASDGNITQVFVDGKVYGKDIQKFEFKHLGGERSSISIEANDLPVKGEENVDTFKLFLEELLK